MVQVEILERRERSVLVQITFPDGTHEEDGLQPLAESIFIHVAHAHTH